MARGTLANSNTCNLILLLCFRNSPLPKLQRNTFCCYHLSSIFKINFPVRVLSSRRDHFQDLKYMRVICFPPDNKLFKDILVRMPNTSPPLFHLFKISHPIDFKPKAPFLPTKKILSLLPATAFLPQPHISVKWQFNRPPYLPIGFTHSPPRGSLRNWVLPYGFLS